MKNRKIIVGLAERSYPIIIGPDLFQSEATFDDGELRGRRYIVVTNDVVVPRYLSSVAKWFSSLGKSVEKITIPDGEQFKSQETLTSIYDQLIAKRADRSTTVIALGGGVVGDLAGFAAASYQRGIPFIQIPTTLLAQVDSSVGGKTAINHPAGKNMIGAFHQPIAVIIDTEILKTLSKRQFNAGMAEVIKYGIIKDKNFFNWITKNSENIKLQDSESIIKIIKRSCEIKAEIVSQDEKEKNIRALLNLGHTFGHAIENVLGYGKWLHGEAIACGFLIASSVAIQNKTMNINQYNDIKNLLKAFDLPTKLPKYINIEDLFKAMLIDKKVKNNKMVYVLPNGIGDSYITNKITKIMLIKALKQHAE